MTKSLKAALLSALIFPGVGHFFLKKNLSGIALSGIALSGLYCIVSQMVERALQITDKIQHGEIPLDVAAISELISKQPTGADAKLLNIASTVLIISWLIGIVDSYRVGRLQGKVDASGS